MKAQILILHESTEQFFIISNYRVYSKRHLVALLGMGLFLAVLIFLLYRDYQTSWYDFFYLLLLDRLYFFVKSFECSFVNLFLHRGHVF